MLGDSHAQEVRQGRAPPTSGWSTIPAAAGAPPQEDPSISSTSGAAGVRMGRHSRRRRCASAAHKCVARDDERTILEIVLSGPDGSGEIQVSGARRGADLHVEMSDQGIGLPKDFDSTNQGRASASR